MCTANLPNLRDPAICWPKSKDRPGGRVCDNLTHTLNLRAWDDLSGIISRKASESGQSAPSAMDEKIK